MWQRLIQPTSVDDAIALLAEFGSRARAVAGGTDVLVELQRGVKPAEVLVDLSALDELRGLDDCGATIRLGGLATHNDVLGSAICRSRALPLVQACAEVGAPQIRSRATIAGNLVTASPANDTIAPLMALGATLHLRGTHGARTLPIEDFFTGFRATALEPGELIVAIDVRAMQDDERGVFLKLGLRRAQAISVISLACVCAIDSERIRWPRIAIGCVAPTVIRSTHAEAVIDGALFTGETFDAAAAAVERDIAPIADIRGGAAYRRETTSVLLRRALERLANDTCDEGLPQRFVRLETAAPPQLSVDAFAGTVITRVNGETRELRNAERTSLLAALRDRAGLTGSKEGCAEGECGACTVWLDGKAVMSCLVPAAQAHGRDVVTIEGLCDDERLHPLQQAFIENGAVQCGFCIPGMIMAGAKLIDELPDADIEDRRSAISGNICRCTGYRKILDAMTQAAPSMAEAAP